MADTQTVGIIIAAMVAGVVLFRLYTVLGRRTGHEPTADGRLAPAPPAGAAPAAAPPSDPVSRGLTEIALADRSFDKARFLQGARAAYEIIQKAFAAGDRPALRPLLSDEVFAAFESAIAARGTEAPLESLAGITDARIVAAQLHGSTAEVTVAIRAQFLKDSVQRDAPQRDTPQRDVGDVWTFCRTAGASDPNWILTATSGDPS
jgi:predicted lipid-binding transport protein (Tim44 family)